MSDDRTESTAQLSRRQFLRSSLATAAGCSLVGLGLAVYSRQSVSLPAEALRPPGALDEEGFLGSCLRCGLCVRDCPFDTLKLAPVGDDVAVGTPYFIARDIPCEMCEDIPCVEACPSGALDPKLTDIDRARMGLAVVVDQESCIAFRGLRCEVCFNVCPVRGDAISIDMQHNPRSGKHALFIPVVHSDSCTGCGKCEQACILLEAAIKVLPYKLARGSGGEHYRFGWQEKEKAGEALVTPDAEHLYNLPEGLEYDHAGEGLRQESPLPFSSNPLDTLNRGKGGI